MDSNYTMIKKSTNYGVEEQQARRYAIHIIGKIQEYYLLKNKRPPFSVNKDFRLYYDIEDLITNILEKGEIE